MCFFFYCWCWVQGTARPDLFQKWNVISIHLCGWLSRNLRFCYVKSELLLDSYEDWLESLSDATVVALRLLLGYFVFRTFWLGLLTLGQSILILTLSPNLFYCSTDTRKYNLWVHYWLGASILLGRHLKVIGFNMACNLLWYLCSIHVDLFDFYFVSLRLNFHYAYLDSNDDIWQEVYRKDFYYNFCASWMKIF